MSYRNRGWKIGIYQGKKAIQLFQDSILPDFIKITPENPVLWTGMKGVSAEGRKKLNQMLKRVQHDNRVWFSFFVIPNQVLN